jgi:DNA primase
VAIPPEVVREIRERTDVVDVVSRYVTLKRRGSSIKGLCPFHQEKSPSFYVVPKKDIYHCFGCGESGDVFSFLMKIKGLTFPEAVKELAGPAGVTIEERELSPGEREVIQRRATAKEACAAAAEWFHSNLMTRPDAAKARDYLTARGITQDVASRWRLGWAPDAWTGLVDHLHSVGISPEIAEAARLAQQSSRNNSYFDFFRARLMIPILDERDAPIAFGGRLIEGEGPKYMNSRESEIYDKSRTLYGLNHARRFIADRERVIVVEGYFDVISVAEAGFGEAVATCGTALTEQHLGRLRRLMGKSSVAYVTFDTDEAGMRAAERSLPLFLQQGVVAKRLVLPGAKDPDEFLRAEGAESFEKHLVGAQPLFDEVLHRMIRTHGVGVEGRRASVEDVAPLLRLAAPDSRPFLVSSAARILGENEQLLHQAAGRGPIPQMAQRPTGQRWVGSTELNRLIWLLLHHPNEVQNIVAEADPALVTDREDVRWAIGQLLAGESLGSILPDLPADVGRVLNAAAAREGLHDAEDAADAARQILGRFQFRALNAQLSGLRQELSSCDPDLNGTRYRELLEKRADLQRQCNDLKSLVGPLRR